MADQKISQLPSIVTPAVEDLFVIIDDPGGTPVSKNISYGALFNGIQANTIFSARSTFNANVTVSGTTATFNANVVASGTLQGDLLNLPTANTIATASDTGTKGDIRWDDNYIYVCTATNTWKRAAIATW